MIQESESKNPQDWSALPVDDVLTRFSTTPRGLSNAEAAERLARYGRNRLPTAPRRSAMMRFLLQFHNVLIYVLLAAALTTALMGRWVDTSVIIAVVVINAVIGFVQEGKAEEAMDAVRKMLSLQATVLRGGKRIVLPAEEIVPGDIVVLQSGDKAPADLRLIRVKNLQMQEAALTGESAPVEKRSEPVAPGSLLGDRASMAFSSTLATYGQATGVVVATGAATEIGRISAMLSEVQDLTTPLLRRMSGFGRWLTAAILILAAAAYAFGVFIRHFPPSEMFMVAVGLAVAAIPEGLPAIITVTLAMGVRRMAIRNAIVRRLPAVETLGSVSTICTDKTGTLTRNEMTVRTVVTRGAVYETSGVGYAPRGAFSRGGSEVVVENERDLTTALRGAMLCCDAVLEEQEGEWRIDGDPTEGALLVAAAKAGLRPRDEARLLPRTDEIPFESQHRYMATLHHDHDGNGFVFVKGAPERILEMCRLESMDGEERPLAIDFWHSQIDAIAARGQRVLALASKRTRADHRDLTHADVAEGLTLIGLFGLIDPPREEAVAAIHECLAAGISVKMITGDHAATASAIARDLGLPHPDRALTGRDLEEMTDDALKDAVLETNVFARASPEHKLRLVIALQNRGQIVSMTGDGVNDAPALKRADIGVAMGHKGTEAAKEASEIVLADDNFASIAHAVREGRAVYDNLVKTILYMLPYNGGQVMSVIGALALGYLLPMTPVQILWVNLVTAVTLGVALAFEPPESDTMARPPMPADAPIASRFFIWRVAFISVLMMLATFGMFLWEMLSGASLETAQTAAVNMLVAGGAFYLFNARFTTAPSYTWQGLTGSRPVLIAIGLTIILQAAFTYLPAMETLLGTEPLTVDVWWRIAVVGLALFTLVELEKAVVRNWTAEAKIRAQAPAGATAEAGGNDILSPGWGWRLPAAAMIALTVAGGWLIWSQHPGREIRYLTQAADRGAVVRSVSAAGVIRPVNTVPLVAPASGVIRSVDCDVAMQVRRGQICARVDVRPDRDAREEKQAILAAAEARLKTSRAALAQAQADLARDRRLAKRGAITRVTLEKTRSDYEQARAQTARDESLVAESKAAMRAAPAARGVATVVAPAAGVVIERNVEPGDTVTAGSEAQLFLIGVDLAQVNVEAQVRADDAGSIKTGDRATFTVAALPDRVFAGEVIRVAPSPRLGGGVQNYEAVIGAANPDLTLQPGMTAEATIAVERRDDALRAPASGLRYCPPGHPPPGARLWPNESSRLWILRDGRPQSISVWPGLDDGKFVEIVKGELQPGDAVIVGETRDDATDSASGSR